MTEGKGNSTPETIRTNYNATSATRAIGISALYKDLLSGSSAWKVSYFEFQNSELVLNCIENNLRN